MVTTQPHLAWRFFQWTIGVEPERQTDPTRVRLRQSCTQQFTDCGDPISAGKGVRQDAGFLDTIGGSAVPMPARGSLT